MVFRSAHRHRKDRVVSRSVFAGGFTSQRPRPCTTDDVHAGDVMDLLDALVRKSLITIDRTRQHARYGMLETIREFAEEQLTRGAGVNDTRQRYAVYYARLAASFANGGPAPTSSRCTTPSTTNSPTSAPRSDGPSTVTSLTSLPTSCSPPTSRS